MNHTKQSRATWNAFLLDWTVKHVLAISEDCYRTRLNLLLAGVVCLAADNPQMIDLMRGSKHIALHFGAGLALIFLAVNLIASCRLCEKRRTVPWSLTYVLAWSFIASFAHAWTATESLNSLLHAGLTVIIGTLVIYLSPKMIGGFWVGHFKGNIIIALVMLSLAALFAPYASVIGTVPLFFGLLLCWLYVLSNIALIAVKRHIHIVTIIVVWGVLCTSISLFPTEDRTVVELTVAEKYEPALRAIEKGRDELGREYSPAEFFWDQNKPDADLYPFAEHYPVFVVAAEGGGARSGYATAFLLAALQDQCPYFADHLYCISAVLGGSVGAAVFACLRKSIGEESTTNAGGKSYRSLTERFFSRDYLAPIVSAGLSGDVIQHFVPLPLFLGDRAEALERAFELGMAYTLEKIPSRDSKNPMSETLGQLYRASFWIPEVIFNTTNIETGRLAFLAKIRLPKQRNFIPINVLGDDLASFDVRVSKAAVLSSRFPYICPPGVLSDSHGFSRCFVDGGYVDNSGSKLLALAIASLKTFRYTNHCIDLYPVIIHYDSGSKPDPWYFPALMQHKKFELKDELSLEKASKRISGQYEFGQFPFFGNDDLFAPLLAILRSRESQWDETVGLCASLVDLGRDNPGLESRVMPPIIFRYTAQWGDLPLGWSLSKEARENVKRSLPKFRDYQGLRVKVDWETRFVKRLLTTDERGATLERLSAEENQHFEVQDILWLLSEPVLEGENGLLIPHLWNKSEEIYKAFDDVLDARGILDGKQSVNLSRVLSYFKSALEHLSAYSKDQDRVTFLNLIGGPNPQKELDGKIKAFVAAKFQSTIEEVNALKTTEGRTEDERQLIGESLRPFLGNQVIQDKKLSVDAVSVPHTVTDARTGLMWSLVPSQKMDWEDAKPYCDNLRLDGYTDWRLPTKEELETLIFPRVKKNGEHIHISDDDPLGQIVPGHHLYKGFAGIIFSGSLINLKDVGPWVMNPRNGYIYNGFRERGYVRAVRVASAKID